MGEKSKILDLDPRVSESMQAASDILNEMMQGPDFAGKKILDLMGQGLTLGEILDISQRQLDAVFVRATQLLEAGNIAAARDLFTLVVRLQPMEPRYTYGLATTYQLEGNFRSAGRLYAVYLGLDADCVHGRLRLAECLLGGGEHKDAAAMFRSVTHDRRARRKAPAQCAYAEEMLARCERLMAGPLQ